MTYQWYLGRGGIQSINTQGGVVGRLLLLREGWGGSKTVVTEGGVGSCCINKCYQLMEFPLDHTNYYY